MRKIFKIGSLILFGLSIIVFVAFLILGINIQNNNVELIKDISLATTVSASFSFSLSITIEIKNYYADKIYENCTFGDTGNNIFELKKKCNQICSLISEYLNKINCNPLENKGTLCYRYFNKIWHLFNDVQNSYESLEDKSKLEKENNLIKELKAFSSTLSKNANEISALMLTYSKIIEINDNLSKIRDNYKQN